MMASDAERSIALEHRELALALLSIAAVTLTARLLGDVARRRSQPALLGEIVTGALLGVTVLGRLAPDVQRALFPSAGVRAAAFDLYAQLAIVFFMFAAGTEIDRAAVWRHRFSASLVSLAGIVVPFGFAVLAMLVVGQQIRGTLTTDPTVLTLLFATALSITALPVITKILADLSMLRSELGGIILASATLDDFVGWILLGFVLALAKTGTVPPPSVLLWTGAFVVLLLGPGRPLLRELIGILDRRAGHGAVLALYAGLALTGAAVTNLIGLHGVFGAFLMGLAVGGNRSAGGGRPLEQLSAAVFGPFFFGCMLLEVDLAANFDPGLCVLTLFIACAGKIIGCGLAARLSGHTFEKSLALGFAMNARGAMEILLARIALDAGILDERLFVALAVVAVVTSMMAGPAIQHCRMRHLSPQAADAA